MDFEGGFVFAPIFTHNPFLSAPTLPPPLLPSLISNHQVLQQMALGSITTAAAAGHGGALLESTHRPYRQHLFMNGPTIAHPPRRLQLTEGGGATSHRIRRR